MADGRSLGKWAGARRAAAVAALLVAAAGPALAWGPHKEVTKAALAVLPEMPRWQAELGAKNVENFAVYCWMPDDAKTEKKEYYVDDYLLIRSLPRYTSHLAPAVQQTIAPHFRRSLQALRTETPANACRQVGPLLHYVEDLGAPPHSGPKIPQHTPLEGWVKAAAIGIAGYKPQLLGRTDDEALQAIEKRAEVLRAFAAERCEKALPLVKVGETERPNVEPLLLECANESARVAADLLYTVFTLGLAKGPVGASLEGTVDAPALARNNDKGARIILLDAARYEAAHKASAMPGDFIDCATDFTTLASAAGPVAADAAWRGELKFHNLPAGTYRVLAYRTGARWAVSEPVTLEVGKMAAVRLALQPTDPPGNLVQNPDGTLAYLPKMIPDRWAQGLRVEGKAFKTRTWSSAKVPIPAGATYRCGAVLKDPSVQVRFWFYKPPATPTKTKPTLANYEPLDLATGQAKPAEVTYKAEKGTVAIVTIESDKPWTDVVDHVWIVPAAPGGR